VTVGFAMRPGPDQQFLAGAAEPPHRREIPEGPGLVVVVPAGEVEDGDIHLLVVPLVVDRLPEVVVGRMLEVLFHKGMARPVANSSIVARGSRRMASARPNASELWLSWPVTMMSQSRVRRVRAPY